MPTFIPYLKQAGLLDQLNVTICNVGSRKISDKDDYGSQGWQIFAPNLTIYGFDADVDACELANADLATRQVNWHERHIPLAISDMNGERTLYITNETACSSLYPPNVEFLSRLQDLHKIEVEFTVEIETTTLDTFCQAEQVSEIDFLQIDVQGAELDVLKGSTQILQTVLAIQVEVEFVPLYLDQPLFADVDAFLRNHEFTLFDLKRACRARKISPIVSSLGPPGQVLWGDAYYWCDLLQPTSMVHKKSPEQMLKLACIADILNFPDYSLELLNYLTLNYGDVNPNYNFADIVFLALKGVPGLSQDKIMQFPVMENLKSYLSTSIST
jgi:FkbM family methyltransferase